MGSPVEGQAWAVLRTQWGSARGLAGGGCPSDLTGDLGYSPGEAKDGELEEEETGQEVGSGERSLQGGSSQFASCSTTQEPHRIILLDYVSP